MPRKPAEPTSDAQRLTALRDRLEAVLADPGTTPRDLATVSREYRLLLAALAEKEPSNSNSVLDEIAQRRAARGAS